MSHIRCFFCGKDSAISGFDPSQLDLDIYVRQVYSRGYGGGFDYGPDESVLGDDFFTPKIYNRCIEYINLLIENGIIDKEDIEARLKIGITVDGVEDLIPYKNFILMQQETIESLRKNTNTRLNYESNFNYFNSDSYNELLKKNNKYEKDIRDYKINKKIDNILLDLNNISNSTILREKDDWYLELNDDDPKIWGYIYQTLYKMKLYERNMLQKRIKTRNYNISFIFNFMRDEPTVNSYNEALLKRPNIVYYMAHGYLIPT